MGKERVEGASKRPKTVNGQKVKGQFFLLFFFFFFFNDDDDNTNKEKKVS